MPAPLYTSQPSSVLGTHTRPDAHPVHQVEQVNKSRAQPDCEALAADIPSWELAWLLACPMLLVSIADFLLGVELCLNNST